MNKLIETIIKSHHYLLAYHDSELRKFRFEIYRPIRSINLQQNRFLVHFAPCGISKYLLIAT